MFDWICDLISAVAYNTAVDSAGLASINGLYQMEEPEALQKIAKERKE